MRVRRLRAPTRRSLEPDRCFLTQVGASVASLAPDSGFFSAGLAAADPELAGAVARELHRQQSQIELIASENIVSRAVLEAQGSVLTNKYAEGYPGPALLRRLRIRRRRRDAWRSNAPSGCSDAASPMSSRMPARQANEAVYLALLKPGDTILGMSLAAGGHLTHGAPPNISGKWFNAVDLRRPRAEDARIDFDEVERLAETHRPKLIIAGGSAYPRIIDFARFRAIADEVGAYLMVDMAHFAGLVAGGAHPSPLPHAHVVTTTTHKTLRGPRGGMILTNDEEIGKKINSAIFPGAAGRAADACDRRQGGRFGRGAAARASRPMPRRSSPTPRRSPRPWSPSGLEIVSGGTDTHLMLVDLRPLGLTGRDAETGLERAGMTCNKNGIPFDPQKPTVTSGIRLGSPAATTRGFGADEFRQIGEMDRRGAARSGASTRPTMPAVEERVRRRSASLRAASRSTAMGRGLVRRDTSA